ncbi:Uncharacterised protein [uncultured archaeon]|nr:Uncharacterised protein [uncultured archaeon]
MADEDVTSEWSLSNYLILTAVILLVTTGIVSGLGGSAAYANQLAINIYFLLIAGVAIRFFELILPETFIQRLKAKLPKINRGENSLNAASDYMLDFFTDITKNVGLSLLIFFLIILGYGALVDWFFLETFIRRLVYVIIIFFALHLILRVRS